MDWPPDADGEVMRRLEAVGFPFDQATVIDFNVDFGPWPPPPSVLDEIAGSYPDAEISSHDKYKYVLVQLKRFVTYEGVLSVQRRLTDIADPYGGICEAWGVRHEPTKS